MIRPITFANLEELLAFEVPEGGIGLGETDPIEITQLLINSFAEVTGDDQWIHIDVQRALSESPFGGPIAHGLLSLSLTAKPATEMMIIESGVSAVANYGYDKVRFPSPIRAGSMATIGCRFMGVREEKGKLLASVRAIVQVVGDPKPACVADGVVFIMPAAA